MPRKARRPLRILAAVLSLVVAVTLGWFAAKVTLTSSETVTEAPAQKVVSTVAEQTVGKSLNYSVTSVLPTNPIFYNVLTGTVTFVSEPGVSEEGSVLYSVDNQAVRVIKSDGGFFRDLSAGAKGTDVAALQSALKRLGFLTGTADGTWGLGTTLAVKNWQKKLGTPQTGSIAHGELVAVGELPASLVLAESLAAGKPIAAGEATVSAASGDRQFRMTLTPEQARGIPQDTKVEVLTDTATWPAVIVGTEENQDGHTVFLLESPEGGPVCQAECESLGGAASLTLRAMQHVIPKVSGPAVPTIAVRTNTAGETHVLREDGSSTAVTVIGSGDGFTVVEGLAVRDKVVALEAATEPKPAAPESAPKDTPCPLRWQTCGSDTTPRATSHLPASATLSRPAP